METKKTRGRIIAVIGAGGKTTLCRALMRVLPGRRIFTTTTHIFLPPELPCLAGPDEGTLLAALEQRTALCVTGPLEKDSGKATPPPEAVFAILNAWADWMVVEADGARGMLLKAHGPYEPVIPQGADLVLYVMGLKALGMPLSDAVHRRERIADVFHKSGGDPATAADFAAAALAARDRVGTETLLIPVVNGEAAPGAADAVLAALREAGMPGFALPRVSDEHDPVLGVAGALSRLPAGALPAWVRVGGA